MTDTHKRDRRGQVEDLRESVRAVLAGRDEPATAEGIRQLIAMLRTAALFPQVSDDDAEEIARWIETIYDVSMTDGTTLQTDFEPWLDDARADIKPYYWDRYRRLLERRGFGEPVLATFDRVTDRVLGLLQNPRKEGQWDRRGMVMGHVQSGKTANYIGLVSKAADAGYRVVVVIAGLQNNLRNQTQHRIDEGFIGLDTGKQRALSVDERRVGVGRLDSRRTPTPFTTTHSDFKRDIASSVGVPLRNLTEPAVFVIKKNLYTLTNLIEWLRDHNARHGTSAIRDPMLLIDDEADNASINIAYNADEVSRINRLIRGLLGLFERSCYIGYTATPFANIFIDPETDNEMIGHDLFPRDFLVSLDAPSNYFGPSRVFTEGAGDVVRHIEDHEDLLPLSHRIDHSLEVLPPSLETAVRAFLLARAIRLVRGQEREHNSMLVNVSRFVVVQNRVRTLLHEFVGQIRASLQVHGKQTEPEALRDPEIRALRNLFRAEYESTCEVPWAKVQEALWKSVSAVRVVAVNSKADEPLDYAAYDRTGLNVITVGGLSLSRGLTLEGLTVSYVLRNSMMYDTLLQMGRWFGYRPNYDDLCRVWLTEEAEGWYAHISESIEELRDEVRQMQRANATPEEFGLCVRSHPDRLIVTARNKMGSGRPLRVSIGLANNFVETAILRHDAEALGANRRAAASLAHRLQSEGLAYESPRTGSGGRLVRGAQVEEIDQFLAAFRNHDDGSHLTATEPVRKYIRERAHDELPTWDVLFAGVNKPRGRAREKALVDDSLGFPLYCQRRVAGKRSDPGTILFITNKQRVSSRGIERVGLSEGQIRQAEENYREGDRKGALNFPDKIYREVRKRPLLVVHLLAVGGEDSDLSDQEPVVAWSISFPRSNRPQQTVEYVVNTTWLRERYGDEREDDDL